MQYVLTQVVPLKNSEAQAKFDPIFLVHLKPGTGTNSANSHWQVMIQAGFGCGLQIYPNSMGKVVTVGVGILHDVGFKAAILRFSLGVGCCR